MATAPKTIKAIRKIRHWKQRYQPGARFAFRRATPIPRPPKSGKGKPKRVEFVAGELIPDWVIELLGPAKLRRWWESHRIELFDFDDPNVRTGRVNPADPTGQRQGGTKAAPGRKASKKKATSKKGKGSAKKKAAKKKAAKGEPTAAKGKGEPTKAELKRLRRKKARQAQKAAQKAAGAATSQVAAGVAQPEGNSPQTSAADE